MRTATQWDPPASALAHLLLRQAAIKNGFDDLAVRELLRVINAHPRLVAHARVFDNLVSLLDHIASGSVGRLGNWSVHLNEWVRVCRWASLNANALSKQPGLEQFDDQPQSVKDHPHIGEGVDRHPVAAAMWNRHQSVSIYPPGPDNLAAWRYFNLQTHLLHSYIDARWTWVSLDAYEKHDGPKERPIAPALSGAASRAVREFSHTLYDNYLSKLNSDLLDTAFYMHLRGFEGNDEGLSANEQKRATAYLIHLQRYFSAAWRVHSGRRPRSRFRTGGGGGPGSKVRIPGFISVAETQVFIKNPQIDATDEDSWPIPTVSFWGPSGQDDNENDTLSLEKSGLCPSEDLEPILELVEASEYTAKIHSVQYGYRAREMAAQSYKWDWNQLTTHELKLLWDRLEHNIAAADDNPSNKSVARYNRISALQLKIMLMYGQTFDRAHSLQIVWIPPGDTLTLNDPDEIEELVLFVQGHPNIVAPTDKVLGFGLPALSPIYKTELDEDLSDLSRQAAESLLLPDVSNLGNQLLAFYRSSSTKDQKVFHIDYPTALKGVKKLLSSIDNDRITLPRISRTLPSLLTQQTGDASLAWVAFSMKARETEPRLHYTMHSTAHIRKAYARSARTLLRKVSHIPSPHLAEVASKDQSHIGCRFVLSFHTLQELITALKERLTSRYERDTVLAKVDDGTMNESTFSRNYKDLSNRSEVMQYDRDYLFYTFLLLTISTGTRAIKRPVSLYLEWQAASEPKKGLLSGLWDKETMFFDKSRLINVLPTLAQQFKNYRLHIEFLMRQLGKVMNWKSSARPDQLLITFDDKLRPGRLSPTWIEEQFNIHLGVSVPANFSRAFLRTELLERGIHAELVDAYLGHASEGESPFSKLSTFDYGRYASVLQVAITQLQDELGMEPIESRLVPFPTRLATR